jgi:hypothetical protein
MTTDLLTTILTLIEFCNSEPELDQKILLLYRINSILPTQHRLNIPSLVTDDYIETALYQIEEKTKNHDDSQ